MNARRLIEGWPVQTAAAAAATVFTAGLALFSYVGTYARYWADDYCYSGVLQQAGFIRGVIAWYQGSGNRFSTLSIVALSDWIGPRMISFLPALLLVLWVTAWFFFLSQLTRLLDLRVNGLWLGLFSLVQVYFIVLLAPDRLQTVYWRMGTGHYTAPLPLLLTHLGLLIRRFRAGDRGGAGFFLGSGLLAFFAAGFSETYAAQQAGLFGLGLLVGLLFAKGPARKALLPLLVPGLVGSLVAMIVMFLSPHNALRQAVMPAPENLWLIIPTTLRHTGDFIFFTLRGQPLPFLVYALATASTGLLAAPPERVCLPGRTLAAGAVAALGVAAAGIAFSFAPSAYANLQYPAGRALMPGAFMLLTGLGAASVLAALAVRGRLGHNHMRELRAAALIALVLVTLYPFRAASAPLADLDRVAIRAERWDARDREIRQAAAAGTKDVLTRQVDVVQTLEDMGPDPAHWVNRCAALYYGVNTITALP